jgi:hypothetical protein
MLYRNLGENPVQAGCREASFAALSVTDSRWAMIGAGTDGLSRALAVHAIARISKYPTKEIERLNTVLATRAGTE